MKSGSLFKWWYLKCLCAFLNRASAGNANTGKQLDGVETEEWPPYQVSGKYLIAVWCIVFACYHPLLLGELFEMSDRSKSWLCSWMKLWISAWMNEQASATHHLSWSCFRATIYAIFFWYLHPMARFYLRDSSKKKLTPKKMQLYCKFTL